MMIGTFFKQHIVKRKNARKVLLCAYILLLFLSATTRDFGLTPLVAHSFGPIAAAFVEPAWKLLFWILPALFFIARFNTRDIFGYLKLGNIKQGILWGLIGSVFFFLRMLVSVFVGQQLHFHLSFDDWLNGVILVGLIEEFVFRGFLFQELKTWWKESPLFRQAQHVPPNGEEAGEEEAEEYIDLSSWIPARNTLWACMLSSLLFVAVHFPSWLLQHQPLDMMLATSLFNLGFSFALCFFFTRSQSLWSCILMHSINDLSLLLIL
jgi:uncharacterized protein